MPKVCEICGKGPFFGHSVSHSHKASKKKWKPNLQHVKAKTDSGVRRIWVCTRCLRSGKVTKGTITKGTLPKEAPLDSTPSPPPED
ncbi:MAG: 50S ribosomal protein L28 [Candidatus Aminicenantes bacterium]|nr:50S ribosomal protein L28 [Candidatus Aminicenantes bacterium]